MSVLPPPATILVFTSSDLVGDGLIKLPFVTALRRRYPRAHITWLTGNGDSVYGGPLAPLVAPLLDEVIENARIGITWAEALRRPPLAGRRFDLIIDLQRRVVASVMLRRIPHRCFISGALGFALSDRRPPKALAKPPRFIDQLMRLLPLTPAGAGDPLSCDTPPPAVAMPPPALDIDWLAAAAKLLPPAPGEASSEGPVYVGFAPGARGRHKIWPLARFIALAQKQAERGRVPVFLLGPHEEEMHATIAKAVPAGRFPLQDARRLEFAGAVDPASPLLTIALAGRLTAALANDSGTGHMIATAQTPLVSLFGPSTAEKFAPAVRRQIILRAQDFPNEGGGKNSASAMENIPLAAADAALEDLLSGGGRKNGARTL